MIMRVGICWFTSMEFKCIPTLVVVTRGRSPAIGLFFELAPFPREIAPLCFPMFLLNVGSSPILKISRTSALASTLSSLPALSRSVNQAIVFSVLQALALIMVPAPAIRAHLVFSPIRKAVQFVRSAEMLDCFLTTGNGPKLVRRRLHAKFLAVLVMSQIIRP
jgi:hypothetical protein